MVFTVGFGGTMAYAAVPDHVDLPQQAIDNAKLFPQKTFEFEGLTAIMQPMVTTITDPLIHVTSDVTQAKLIFQRTDGVAGCSGTLVDSTHVLTAAHCMSNGNLVIDNTIPSKAYFYIQNGGEEISYDIIEFNVHSSYDGLGEKGYDIAIITLNETADDRIPVIQIDRNGSDDINNSITTRSFGHGGYGNTGNDPDTYPFGIERQGLTQVDALGDTMYAALGMLPGIQYEPGFVLQTDFDNGVTTTDAFAFFFFGFPSQLGTYPDDEDGSTCFGDSGGALYNQAGEVTGVNSYVITLSSIFGTTDVTPELDCSFGEFTGHTRVSSHTAWIDSIITPIVDPPPNDPITCGPGTVLDANNQCIPDNPISCGPGTAPDANNQCIPDNPISCGPGTVPDANNQCIPDYPNICGDGTTLNATNYCELDAATTQILADVNTLLTTNNCSPMAPTIPDVLICIDDLIGPPPPPDVSIEDVTDAEGNSGTKSFNFVVTRSGDTSAETTVDFTTVVGTATDSGIDADYAPLNDSITFGIGETQKSITIQVNGDTTNEGDETFTVVLSNPTPPTVISDGIGLGMIQDDDSAVITVTGIAPNEGNLGDTVPLTVNGTGFDPSAVVTLQNGNGKIPKITCNVENSTSITCEIVISSKGTKVGSWDLTVTNPDTSSASAKFFVK